MKPIKVKLNKLGVSGMGNFLIRKDILEEQHLTIGKEYYIVISENNILDTQYIGQPISEVVEEENTKSVEWENIKKILKYLIIDMKRLKVMHNMKDFAPRENKNEKKENIAQNEYRDMTFGEWLMWKPGRKKTKENTVSFPTTPTPVIPIAPAPILPPVVEEKKFKSAKEVEEYAKENYYDLAL